MKILTATEFMCEFSRTALHQMSSITLFSDTRILVMRDNWCFTFAVKWDDLTSFQQEEIEDIDCFSSELTC